MTSEGEDAVPEHLELLEGVRVVDFTQALSGPYCTLMLADVGADVIKIENRVRGDDSRHWGPPFLGSDAAYFMSVNRNKRSVALDLKDPDDVALAHEVVASADVVVENWRPGTAERLGFGAEQLRAAHPGLIVCSISGFGQGQGTRSGYDQIVQGTSGVMPMTGPAGEPTKWGVPIADIAAGMFAAAAISSALVERARTGRGRVIDIAMQDSLISMLTHHAARHLATGVVPPSDHNGHATICPYGMFPTADGFVNLCVGNDSQFQRMCAALGRDDLAQDERFATNPLRVANRAVLLGTLTETLAGLATSDAIAALEQVGVPAGAVADIGEALADESTLARDMVMSFDRDDVSGVRVVNTPWKFDGRAPSIRRAPPHLGEHNVDVLSEIRTGQ
ncbi:CaiB/BaiF CoA transferase family protein [Aeromicrobium yanjiei]|uniref:CoA transferase n=1 Tax=Aeromicrobium yanjiei TaxID=2662028 RepID=A0A5Q2MKW1_9ACTN|nr:CoA transferase [Aeromicrobium yanjiei]QGG40590.1 CoA transferase [Aeromicrobium yanjiei]